MQYLLKLSIILLLSLTTLTANTRTENIDEIIKNKLVLNGEGIRSKWFFDLYVASLYLKVKSQDDMKIVNGKDDLNLRLQITSSMITSEKMEKATLDGFKLSTNGDIKKIQKEIDSLMLVFSEKINEGDIYDFYYTSKNGLNIYKNKVFRKNIKSFEFKKSMFGIWLGKEPTQESLKKQLLGK